MNHLFILSENVAPVIVGSTYFYMGGKYWTEPFTLSLILPVIGFSMLYFIPRSPNYLQDSGQINEAKIELRKIAKTNGNKLPTNFILQAKNGVEDTNKSDLLNMKLKLFTSFSNIIKLSLIIMLFVHSNAQQVMWGFYAKYIHINIFLLNLIDSFTSTLMIFITYYLLEYFDLKPLLISIILVSFLCVIPLTIEVPYEILIWMSYLGILA